MKQTLVTIRVEAQNRHEMAGMSTVSLPVAEGDALAAARHLVEVLKREPGFLGAEAVLRWLWTEAEYAAGVDEGYAAVAGKPRSQDEAVALALAVLGGDSRELPARGYEW